MKKLIEKKNDLIAEMSNIVNKAKAENRAVTADEASRFEDCKNEVASIEATIKMNEEMGVIENKVVVAPADLTNEQKDEKAFLNIIRQIKNADAPVTYGENGAIIPTSVAKKIIARVEAICPIWTMSEHYNVKGNLTIPVEDATNSTLEMTYADEFSDAESGKVVFKSVNLGEFLGRALCKVSNSLINNTTFDLVTYIVNRVAERVAKFLEKELLVGTAGKIEGLKGVTQTVTTANSGKIAGDDLIDLQEAIPDDYQANAVWIMSRDTRKAIRKLKDADNRYLLERDFNAKWGYTLLGKPVYTSDNMDNGVYYGDFSGLAVKISENVSVQVLKEKYAEQHATGVLAFVGCDAKVQNVQKIARLTVKA